MLAILCIGHTSAHALQLTGQNWSSNEYFQGDSGTVNITLYNNIALAQWYIKTIEIQFDWQIQSNIVYSTQVGQDIASGQSGTYNISFDIPSSINVGTHSYTIYYVGLFNDVHSLATGSFYVHDMYEKQYDGLLSSVQSQLNSATSSNYNSPDARSDLSQAQSYYVQATTLASQDQFQSAIDKLNAAQSMISQANSAEQSYSSNSYNSGGSSNNNYYSNSSNYNSGFSSILIIIIIPAVAVGGGIVFWKMKKKNTGTKSKSSNYDVKSTTGEEKRLDAIHETSNEKVKVENMKNESIIETKPKIETIQAPTEEEKTLKSKKAKKTKEEIEHNAKALGILKERLATGTITKSEYTELKKEFE